MKRQPLSNLPLRRICTFFFVGLAYLWLGALAVRAETVIFTDNFDSPLGTNWQIAQNRQVGDALKPCMNKTVPAVWTQTNGLLQLVIDSPMCMMDFVPINLDLRGLGLYHLSFRFLMQGSTQMDRSMVFLWQDPQNWYNLKLFGNNLFIEKVVNGMAYQLPGALRQYPFQLNHEYQFTIEFLREQKIRIWVDQQLVLEATDQFPFLTPLERQTISLRGSVGAASRSITTVDDIRLTAELSPSPVTQLNVQLWKQNEAAWANEEYDHAHVWSSMPTMSRWGCAVTSMAMILRYYGITELPSGIALTPQSLNQWLKEQVDGYFNGNLNWLAISRLTQQVSPKLQTPKLELSRTDGTLAQIVEFAKQEILANKPVILGYPGHFFVADGVDNTANTLLIKDPYYSYQRLSQRPTLNEVNTIRRFQPSHTDLSYLLVNVSPEVELLITDDQGSQVTVEKVTEYLQDPTGETDQRSPQLAQYFIRQPETGRYTITLTRPEHGQYELDVFQYDIQGNVTQSKESGEVGPEGQDVVVEYHKEAASPVPSVLPLASSSPLSSPAPSPTPLLSPSPQLSPQPSPQSPIPNTRQAWLYRRLLAELHQLQRMFQLFQQLQFLQLSSSYQRLLHNLERLNQQTNPSNN